MADIVSDRREERRWKETDLRFINGRPKVYVCFGGNFGLITSFFCEIGFTKANTAEEADLIVYGGGIDVDPALYGQKRIKQTSRPDRMRDSVEKKIYETAFNAGIPQLGICRGSQFLHVMNGGKLWQHVNNHAGSPHMMYDMINDHYVRTSSTHHQMMQWNKDMTLIACCDEERATYFEDDTTLIDLSDEGPEENPQIEVEVCSYPDSKTMCIQGHPEYGPLEFTTWCSMLIKQWFIAVSPNREVGENNNLPAVLNLEGIL